MANLVIEKIEHSFAKKTIINCDYTEIKSGKITALIGLNGEGKSTLFKIIYGSIKANYCRIFYENRIIENCYLQNNLIAYLPQETLIPLMIKVKNFIKLAAISNEDKIKLTKRFKNSLNQNIGSLSGGENRLLEILYILYLKRKFTLLDEPFKALEPKHISEVKKIISNSKRAIIISSHLFIDLKQISDEIILMKNGRLLKIDDVESLKELGYLPILNNNN